MARKSFCLTALCWIGAGPQLVVGAPGSGKEALGKWSGSLRGSNTAFKLEYSPKHQAEHHQKDLERGGGRPAW